jgi:hypothetical protein
MASEKASTLDIPGAGFFAVMNMFKIIPFVLRETEKLS